MDGINHPNPIIMHEGKPKSPEQFYQEHREDAEKLGKAQRSGNAKSLHEAVSDYHEHLAEASEAGDTRKHPELYDQARKEMDRDQEYSSEAFAKGMPALTPEQEKVVEQMKEGSNFPKWLDVTYAINVQNKFHLPKETIQFLVKEVVICNVKNGDLRQARELTERFSIPESEEYRALLEREEKAKLALRELRNQRDEILVDNGPLNKVVKEEGVDYIKMHEGVLEQAIEYIKTHDTPMSVEISITTCPTNDTVQLLEKLDEVAAEKRAPIKIRIDRDCVFDNKEVVAMELFTSKRWRPRIETF